MSQTLADNRKRFLKKAWERMRSCRQSLRECEAELRNYIEKKSFIYIFQN